MVDDIENERYKALLAWIRDTYCSGNTSELARRISKDKTYVARLFMGQENRHAKNIGPTIMKACKAAFSLPSGFWDWEIVDGVVDVPRGFDPKISPIAGLELDNLKTVDLTKRVPLISWVQAGIWAEVQDNFSAGEADEWVLPAHSKPNGHAFALLVEGDSMTSPYPGARSFPEGTVLIVDPDMGYGPGDYVIAKDVVTQSATFKQLTTDGGRWFLKPINPTYQTMEIDDPAIRVIGRVCEFQPPGGKL